LNGWAREHDLPYFDDRVRFPDFRIEYELARRDRHEEVEVVTEHYRGAHAASGPGGIPVLRTHRRDGSERRTWRRSTRGRGVRVIRAVPHYVQESVRPGRVQALMNLGFPIRQARFLVHVLVFSGVFLER